MALDGLGEKLKSLFKAKEDPRFKGQGRRLGTGEAPSSNPRPPNRPLGSDTAADATVAAMPLKPPPQPLGGRCALPLSRSHRTEEVVLDAAVMANTPTGREAHLVAAHKPLGGTPTHIGLSSSPSKPTSTLSTTSPGGSPSDPSSRAGTGGGGGDGLVGGLPGLNVDLASGNGSGRGREALGGSGGGGGAEPMCTAGRGKTQHLRSATSNLCTVVSTISTPTAAEKRMGGFRCPAPPNDGAMADYGLAPATSQAYELQRCLALVLSSRPLSTSNISTASVASAAAAAPTPAPLSPSSPPPLSEPPTRAAVSASPNHEAAESESDPTAAGSGESGLKLFATSSSSSKSLTGTSASTTVDAGAGVGAGTGRALGGDGGGGGTAAADRAGAAAGPRECCDALLRVLRNVMTRPDEPKFRQIRLSNPRVLETIVGVPGAVEFLEAAGFQMQFAPDDGPEPTSQGFLVLPDEVPPSALAEPFRMLSAVMAAHGFTGTAPTAAANPSTDSSAAATAATASRPSPPQQQHPPKHQSRLGLPTAAAAVTAAAPAVDRCTQVLLPVATDVEVPDWFFERTGAEIREQWSAMLRRREEAERFMTRTMKEVRRQQEAVAAAAANGGGGEAAVHVATVRVRFPEGVCLQGYFGASEPVSRVFEWVAAALRSPALTFELVKPDRRPLETTASSTATSSTAAAGGKGTAGRPLAAAAAGSRPGGAAVPLTVRAADMLPSILLNLRPTGQEAAALAAANLPLLSDELLRTTRPQ